MKPQQLPFPNRPGKNIRRLHIRRKGIEDPVSLPFLRMPQRRDPPSVMLSHLVQQGKGSDCRLLGELERRRHETFREATESNGGRDAVSSGEKG